MDWINRIEDEEDRRILYNLIEKRLNYDELDEHIRYLSYSFFGSKRNYKRVIKLIRKHIKKFKSFEDIFLFLVALGYEFARSERDFEDKIQEYYNQNLPTYDYYGEKLTANQIYNRVFGWANMQKTAYIRTLAYLTEEYGEENVVNAVIAAERHAVIKLPYVEAILRRQAEEQKNLKKDKPTPEETKILDWSIIRAIFSDDYLKYFNSEDELKATLSRMYEEHYITPEYREGFTKSILKQYKKIKEGNNE